MAKRLPTPATLRAEAHRQREQALRIADAEKRRVRLAVAQEYDKLAAAIEAEHGLGRLGHDHAAL
ncbi:MAG TPA: hypothetical protein VMH36_13975 [Alphaproteobacteria bacterium]|nr:hypothetical protein [Alphaproteobacteria bacterium]